MNKTPVTTSAGHTYYVEPKMVPEEPHIFRGWEITDPKRRTSLVRTPGEASRQGYPREVEAFVQGADSVRTQNFLRTREHFSGVLALTGKKAG